MSIKGFRKATSAVRQPLLLVGVDGRVLVANAVAKQVFGADIEGAPIAEQVEDRPALERLLARAAGSVAPLPGACTVNGERWRCDASRTVVDEKPAVLLQLASQVAASRRFTALNRKIDELNAEIRRRQALEGERLELLEREREARLEAEALGRLKDEFLASLSHELRTPLQAIAGWAGILRKRSDPALVKRAVDTIERNVAAQNRLIEDLLDASRADRGDLKLTRVPTDLVQLVREVADSVGPTIEAREIEFSLAVSMPELVALVDPDRLSQILLNLLTNACRYTPKGGQVDLTVAQVANHVEIRCVDTGQGIAPDFLPYIFDRFRRQDASSTRRTGGLGLGLSIARHLVELHGGLLIAESEGVGRGATFMVTLPLSEFERNEVVTAQPATAEGDLLAGVRVAIAEDHADSRELLQALLSLYGAEAVCFPDAVSTRDHVGASEVDVIVSDLEMPGEDGFTMIRKVRAEEAEAGRSPVPAIALTAHSISQVRQRALDAGFDDFISKPVDADALIALVRKLAAR